VEVSNGDMSYIIEHHGIIGMKWGIRRFQNPDGSLTPRGQARLDRKDEKWAKTKGERVKQKTQRIIKPKLETFVKNELNPRFKTNGKLTSATILKYNNKMAELMNLHIGNIPTPSGRVLRFVAKRGDIGVHTAYADAGYDLSRLTSGVFTTGKVAYRNENLMNKGG